MERYGYYDFRGRGKRNRAALKEANDVANTRITFSRACVVVPRDGTARPAPGVTPTAPLASPGGRASKSPESPVLQDITNVTSEETKDIVRSSDAQELRGSETLKYIVRGGGLGGDNVAMRELAVNVENKSFMDAINGEDWNGVKFPSILDEIYARVESRLSPERFARWLATAAATFASTDVPGTPRESRKRRRVILVNSLISESFERSMIFSGARRCIRMNRTLRARNSTP